MDIEPDHLQESANVLSNEIGLGISQMLSLPYNIRSPAKLRPDNWLDLSSNNRSVAKLDLIQAPKLDRIELV